MAESIISDWLSDFNSLQESELRSFAAQHENNHEISTALYTILNERIKYKDLLYPVCTQFCNFYRSNEIELRRFTLQFVPILIYLYLNTVALGDKKSCRCVETLLICIYNIEVSSDDGSPKVVSFRMPVLAQASIYHEEKSLQASDLRRWEENSNKDINWGPLPSIESINAQNRLKIMTALLFSYNQQLSLIHKPALYHLCKTTSQLVNQGFSKIGHIQRPSYGNDPTLQQNIIKPMPRVAVTSQFLVELAHAAYFAMFNEFASAAIEAVNDIHNRARYEMLPEVVLVTNAIKNSLHANPSGQPSDGPMGISVALTPATTTVTVSKSMITNASFRTKKLPDDIPIQGPRDENGQLSSINEESENDVQNSKNTTKPGKDTTKSHKVPFGGFKKLKEKDKDKEKDKEKDNKNINKNGITPEELKQLTLSTKKINSKEKLSGKASLQMGNVEGVDSDKTSPLGLVKRKSSSIDIMNIPLTTELIPIQTLALTNGGVINSSEEKLIPDDHHHTGNLLEVGESFDSGNDITITNNNISAKTTMDIKSHGSMQVSQV